MPETKILYANSVNLVGLYKKTPVKCEYYSKYCSCDGECTCEYWDRSGNYSCPNKEGSYSTSDNYVVGFVSADKEKVQIWTDGVLAGLNCVKRFCS